MLCLVCTFIGVTMVGEDELNGVHVGDIECCHERERESIHLKIQNFDILNIQIYGYWNSNIQVFGFGFSYV